MSSYEKNNYNEVIRGLLYCYKPEVVHEFGVLDGFISKEFLFSEYPYDAFFVDLFEDYEFKHCSYEDFLREIESDDGEWQETNIIKGDALSESVVNRFEDNSMEFVHLDISNDGQKIEDFLSLYHDKLKNGAILLIEGGSQERDEVEWMLKYNKRPIKPFLENCGMDYFTFDPFPSLTILKFKKYV